jgi:hypothetical protein
MRVVSWVAVAYAKGDTVVRWICGVYGPSARQESADSYFI